MPALQKHAIFTLIVAAATLGVFTGMLPFLGLIKASAAFALLAFWALSGIFYRKHTRDGVVESVYDERDRQIQQRANTITFAFLWVVFVLACMNAWRQYGETGKIPASFLPPMVGLGGAVLLATWSIAILWQYHRQN